MKKSVSLRSTSAQQVVVNGQGVDRRLYYLSAALLLVSILLHQPLLLIGGIVMLLLLLITDIWAHYSLLHVSYQRSLSESRVLFGEEIILSIAIENGKMLPLTWLELAEQFAPAFTIEGIPQRALHSNKQTLNALFSLNWYERVIRRYTLRCMQRGVHAIGPTIISSGDAFGFLRQEMYLDDPQYILVYPLTVPLSSFQLPARHPLGDHKALRRLLEDPSRVIGMRDYVYGDSLRRVDWKATARATQLQSKIYEATTTYTCEIFLNVAMQFNLYYAILPALMELSICAAASVTDWALDQGYAVGLYANTITFLPDDTGWKTVQQEQDLSATISAQLNRRRIHLPATSSDEQRKRIMEVLARIQGYFGTDIEELLLAERSRLPAGATVVLITCALNERIADTLTRMRQDGHAVTILFVGDSPPPMRLAGITVHYLGGEERWKQLATAYSKPADPALPVSDLHF